MQSVSIFKFSLPVSICKNNRFMCRPCYILCFRELNTPISNRLKITEKIDIFSWFLISLNENRRLIISSNAQRMDFINLLKNILLYNVK